MKRFVVHPFFFASFVLLSILTDKNIQNLTGVRAIITSLLAGILIFMLFLIITKDFKKAGLISSVCILLVFSFGQFNALISKYNIWIEEIYQYYALVTIWILIILVWISWVAKINANNSKTLTLYLNTVSMILIIFPISKVLINGIRTKIVSPRMGEYIEQAWQSNGLENIVNTDSDEHGAPLPDIYYIVLDGYARSDVLLDLYQYDNSEFITFLEDRGFYVAENSEANYTVTEFSISSSLNMVHINDMPDFYSKKVPFYNKESIVDTAVELVGLNRVSAILREHGYQIVEFESGFYKINNHNPDIYLRSPDIQQPDTRQLLEGIFFMDPKYLRLFSQTSNNQSSPVDRIFDVHRERIIYTLNDISIFAEEDGNYFIYAHLICPHFPYVFGPDGETLEQLDSYTLMDLNPGKEENIQLYRDQVHYLNKLVMSAVDEILDKSDTLPIIIIQADHGSKGYREKNPNGPTQEKLLLPILNAYYFPRDAGNILYPEISPVNSFRVVFNEYFGSNLPLLSDKSYILSDKFGSLEFIEACQYLNTCSVKWE